jgi:large subunit ribosomal protein L21
MYAIISDGGRQFHVTEGQELQIDYRGEELAEGTEIVFDRVLAAGEGASLKFGRPVLDGAKVTATVVDPEAKGPKLIIQKFRRRKNSKRKTGHRQVHTTVKIESIKA